MTVDAATLREHIETDLGDDALGRLIADAYAFCDLRVGPAGAQSVVIPAGDRFLMLPRPVASADDVAIVERFGTEEAALVEGTDWRWLGGRTLERLSGGSVVFWGYAYGAGDIVVTYTPKDDEAMRDRVVIDLCKLAIAHNALQQERAGDYAATSKDYAAERERIVRQLLPAMGVA